MLVKDKEKLNLQSFYPKELEIQQIDEKDNEITLYMHSRSKSCICHRCGATLNKLHGTHQRRVQDLPILGKRVILDMQINDYQCSSEKCISFAATETFDGFLKYHSRMTERLADFVTLLALETSCESSARILQSMNVKISGDTVIRLLTKRYANQLPPVCGQTIGVDDFAFKKRHTYGTVIVDEATHKTVAVLDGRDADTLASWLKKNKHVTAVTRDRASAYAKAVEEILPNCMQIADRFHLHQNLLEAVKSIVNSVIPVDVKIPQEDTAQESAKEEVDCKKNPNCCG